MIRATLSALFSFFLFLIIHFLDFHFFIPDEKVNSLLGVSLLGLLIFFIFLYILPTEDFFQRKLHMTDKRMKRWFYPLLGVLFYGFLLLGYLEFYFTADRSITFRMLMITNKEPNQVISYEKMYSLYDVPGIIRKRFDDLTYGGYLKHDGDLYYLTEKGKIILTIYRLTIEYLHLGSGEKKNQHALGKLNANPIEINENS